MGKADRRQLLRDMLDAAIAAADPAAVVPAALPRPPKGRTIVIGAGKASAAMAAALEASWQGELSGLVVTRDGYGAACKRIEIVEAAHPVPDARGMAAAERMLALVAGLTTDDLVIALISGGGSALLPLPPMGVTLDDKRELNRILLASGAPIGEMNCVRKHVSRIKGGRLALAAHPAKVVSLVISDVPGDDPALVASGPTIADRSSRAQALEIVARYRLQLPATIRRHLEDPASVAPQPDDPRFAGNEVRLVASAALSLEAAARLAESHGFGTAILSDAIEGEAREVAKVHAALAREVAGRNRPFRRPVVMLSGGETSVTLRGKGRGGRNQEFLLGLAIGIQGLAGVLALAADTDGIDGTEDNAGAFADATTVARLLDRGLKPQALLDTNDAYTAFAALGDLLITGPTRTNVNDFRVILIE
jgi:hydroxypyruvate reductase